MSVILLLTFNPNHVLEHVDQVKVSGVLNRYLKTCFYFGGSVSFSDAEDTSHMLSPAAKRGHASLLPDAIWQQARRLKQRMKLKQSDSELSVDIERIELVISRDQVSEDNSFWLRLRVWSVEM